MKAADLDGQKVLLLMIDRSEMDETGLAAGTARWTDGCLEVVLPGSAAVVQVRSVDVEHGGFPPDRLSDLISTKAIMHLVEECAEGASWCVPMFISRMPEQVETLTCIFAGMASRADDVIRLMMPPKWPNGE
ncbi:hypothetical protein YTPLAS18_40380 [Nitrospira sp.]|nr:hypothetical protein YTPLAS18_40380 [Nitrospira sp.]